jgi:hypothetical protein
MSYVGWAIDQSERNRSTVIEPHSTSGKSNTKEFFRKQTTTTRKSEKSEVVLVLSRTLKAKKTLLFGSPIPVSELYLRIISTPIGKILFLKF